MSEEPAAMKSQYSDNTNWHANMDEKSHMALPLGASQPMAAERISLPQG